jgi:hypothetical protein
VTDPDWFPLRQWGWEEVGWENDPFMSDVETGATLEGLGPRLQARWLMEEELRYRWLTIVNAMLECAADVQAEEEEAAKRRSGEGGAP